MGAVQGAMAAQYHGAMAAKSENIMSARLEHDESAMGVQRGSNGRAMGKQYQSSIES